MAHVTLAITKPEDDKPPRPSSAPFLGIFEHMTAFAAALRSWGLAYLAIFHLPGLFGMEYPGFGPAKEFKWNWMFHILARDLIATWLICGFWDWFLYFSPLKNKLTKYKMNPVYPSFSQIRHDAFVTTTASCAAAGIEIVLCHYWATGQIQFPPLWSNPMLDITLALLLTHCRIPHFHLLHRSMHPWKTTRIPDIGKFLYIQILGACISGNISSSWTIWDAVSRSTLYYSAALIPVLLGLHPVHSLAVIVDCGMVAWLWHDGFEWPGSGDYFHQLHHKHFDCNYGAMHVPMDWLFGTYAGSKEEVSAIWKGQNSGKDANETTFHCASRKPEKVD